ncbi:DNA polymerase I [Bacillaceae bacterium]
MKKFLIIDGNSVANRAFYALPLLSNKSGTYTNAVYGFTNMLFKLLEEEKPTHVLVAFDAGKVVFRHAEYKEYKGKRLKTPPELSEQFPLLKEVLSAFRIPFYEKEGYEADDIIGTLTKEAEERGIETRVVTGDKDMLQLVSPHVKVALTRRGISEIELYDEKAVQEKYGLTPAQIIDLKGLMGDQSDNIPGVPGVGEKTALKLLHEFGTVENVLAHLDEIPGKKLKENLAQHQEDARMSKELATILRDVPLDVNIDGLVYEGYDAEELYKLFQRLEFHSLLDRLPARWKETEREEAAKLAFTIAREENLSELVSRFTSPMAVYVEVDGENYHTSPVVGLGIAVKEQAFYVPFRLLQKWDALKEWLADAGKEKWTYDAKRGAVALSWQGIALNGTTFDVMLASYLLNPSESGHQLHEVAQRKIGYKLPADEDVYGKGAKRQLPEEPVLAEHVARKADAVYRLHEKLAEELSRAELASLYFDLELPLSFVLAEMEQTGVKVDRDKLREMGEQLEEQLQRLTEEIYELAGTEFNINSPKQLGDILFDKLQLPVIKKTKTGYSTSADVLEKLAPQHEIVSKILHFRQLGKLKSTYIEGLTKEINVRTGKIHTIFNQALTATGRLSSTEPNLQNIPIRLEEGRKIRQAFVPSREGWYILAADYSQIELRVLAHISGDRRLVEAFRDGMDVHVKTAMDVFGVAADEVTPLMRRQAKAVNFGIVYGISDYGLSQSLNIPRKEAARFIEKYFAVYEGVKRYMEEVVQRAKKDGYVTTLLHRRRYLPEINSRNFNQRSFAERTAMNTPIQGTAADIIKLAMVNMAERMKQEGLQSKMLLQVHDELIFEVPEEELATMRSLVPEVMENAIELDVPLKVDVNYGKTWYEAK